MNWIPVEQALPRDRQRVLTFCPERQKEYRVELCAYLVGNLISGYRDDWFSGSNSYYAGNDPTKMGGYRITHWQPLPERPKE